MFKHTLPLRYLIPALLLLFSVMTLVAGFISGRTEMTETVRSQVEKYFVQQLHLSQHILEQMLHSDNYGVIKPYISAFGMVRSNRLAVLVGDDGLVVASTQLKLIGQPWQSLGDATDQGFLHSIKEGTEKQISHLDEQHLILGYIKVCGNEGVVGVRRQHCGFLYHAKDSSSALQAAEYSAMRQASFTGIGGLLATIVLAVILYRLVTRRSEYMIDITQRFSNGDINARTEMRGADELACVGEAIDSMFERINSDQQQLRESQSSLSRAQTIAHLGNWEWDIEAGILNWSDEIYRIFGWEPQSFEPDYEHFMSVIHPDDREKVQDAVAKAVGDEDAEYRVDHRVVLDDRTIRYIQENGQVTRNAEGKAIAMIGTFLDITERVKTEEELELFQMMIEKSADPVFLIDNDDNFRMAYVNEAAVQHFGVPREEILRWRIPDWDPNFTYDDLPAHQTNMMENPGMSVETQHMVAGGGLVPVEVTINPIRYRGRNCHFGYINNISERKEVERSLKMAKEQAEDATRTKSEFLANMSHEIRTPMNAIINLAYLAKDEEQIPERVQNYLHKIESSASHLLGIINDILDFSKIEAGRLVIERAPFSLYQMLDSLSTVIGYRVVEKNLEVLFRIEPQVPNYLYGDPLRITQILTNLLSNAIKFTAEGEVVVLVTVTTQSDEWVQLSFVISDTGHGMDIEEQSRLFQAFSQADSSISRRFGGTGLGLVITQRLVTMMGGTIHVESQKGVGSQFTVALTLEKNKQQDKQLQHEDYPDLTKIRVLVADDNETARQIFRENLAAIGIEREVVSSAEELLEILRNSKKQLPYDVVIIDWKMPGIDGVEAARIIRREMKLVTQPHILLCTAYGVDDAISIADEGTVDGALSKPFSPSSLLDSIVNMMGYAALPRHRTGRVLTDELLADLRLRSGAHILVVEDNEINQEIARQLLLKVGMQVTIAGLASEAFKALEEQSFDLILMDIQMPDMDGLEATRHIRRIERFNNLPVVAMTAHALGRDRQLSLAAGMNDHLTKPINPREFYQTIVKWIAPIVEPDMLNETVGGDAVEIIEHRVSTRPLPGINVELGLSKLNGNHELYHELLLKFRQRNLDVATLIRSLLAENKYDQAREHVHAVKGVAGNLGIETLFDRARGLEMAIVERDSALELNTLLEEFSNEHRFVMQGLEQLLNDPAVAEQGIRQIDKRGVSHLLQALAENLEHDLARSMDIVSELKAYMIYTALSDEYLTLEQSLSDFNIEAVKATIMLIKQKMMEGQQ